MAELTSKPVQEFLILRTGCVCDHMWCLESFYITHTFRPILIKSNLVIEGRFDVTVIFNYYTSDSLWKIWLVESIQSIQNSLWTWHDKCNICCRYCIYHVKFKVCLVTKPLGVFSSETKWLNASLLFLRMNFVKKCLIKQLLNSVFAWYHAQPHPIIV